MIDYHTHTYLCKHADGTYQEYLAAAEAAGLDEIGVSDHCPWPDGFDPLWRMTTEEFPKYRKIISDMRAIPSKVKVKYGLEVDWVSGKMQEVFHHLNNEDFDYLIGSIHYTDDLSFDDPSLKKTVWDIEGQAEFIWNRYYELMLELTSSSLFNIIGHFDLPKKFGNMPPKTEKIEKLIDDSLKTAAANNIAIEINTAGLRKPVKEMYPSFQILKKAAKFGVNLTFGSDAHTPKNIAANFAEAITLVKEAGFSKYCSFDQKKMIFHQL